jgi:hypothetical protein
VARPAHRGREQPRREDNPPDEPDQRGRHCRDPWREMIGTEVVFGAGPRIAPPSNQLTATDQIRAEQAECWKAGPRVRGSNVDQRSVAAHRHRAAIQARNTGLHAHLVPRDVSVAGFKPYPNRTSVRSNAPAAWGFKSFLQLGTEVVSGLGGPDDLRMGQSRCHASADCRSIQKCQPLPPNHSIFKITLTRLVRSGHIGFTRLGRSS